jgi:hypothetical protein
MRSGLAATFILLLSAAFCSATNLTDTFAQAQNNCNYSSNAPYSNCDVIGDPSKFDIQSLTYSNSGGIVNLLIYLNSGAVHQVNNQYVLGSFNDNGINLIPGDVFFYAGNVAYDPSDPNTTQYLKYGLSLTNHGNFIAGDLYSIAGGISVETAYQALNGSNAYYRRNEAVLMTGSGSPVSNGSVSVSPYGNGTTNASYVVSVSFPTTSGFTNLINNGQLGILFSSADCGNDVIQGKVSSQTPEPGPLMLMLTGAGLVFAGRKWRKKA